MSCATLKQALDDYVINFDRRVLVTDLLEEHALSYDEVNETLKEHLREQEKAGVKFEKRYLVHGLEASPDNNNKVEVFSLVNGEDKLKEWLAKLQNAESKLYSVEVAGGAKTPAHICKPIERSAIKLKNFELRENVKQTNANGAAAPVKTEPEAVKLKPEAVKLKPGNMFAAKPTTSSKQSEQLKKSPESAASPSKSAAAASSKQQTQKKKSPEKSAKATKGAAANKNTKGIGSFFAAASKQPTAEIVKPVSSAQIPEEKTAHKKSKQEKKHKGEAVADVSMQLFAQDDDEDEMDEIADEMAKDEERTKAVNKPLNLDAESSDEEAQMEALKRDISRSDANEIDVAVKRRRILDSDDEEDEPQNKHEKKEAEEKAAEEPQPQDETFMDEDGFVITKKAKTIPGSNNKAKNKATTSPSSKTTTEKATSQQETDKKKTKQTPPVKTKQGNIMSFFTKK